MQPCSKLGVAWLCSSRWKSTALLCFLNCDSKTVETATAFNSSPPDTIYVQVAVTFLIDFVRTPWKIKEEIVQSGRGN